MKFLTNLTVASALFLSHGASAAIKSNTASLSDLQKVESISTTTTFKSNTFTLEKELLDPSLIPGPGSLLGWLTQPQYVEARINNDAAAVTEDIVPLVANNAGLDNLDLGNIQARTGTLPSGITILLACHNSSAPWNLNLNDVEVRLPIDANSIVASIRDNGRINTDIDENGLDAEFELQFEYPKNVGGFYCNTFGHNVDISVNVNVNGVEGEFDVNVEDDGTSRVQISRIRNFEVSVDSVSFDSSFLTSLTNLGIGIANIFGLGCSNITDCVNMVVDNELTDSQEIKDALKRAINNALDVSLSIDGGTDIGAASIDYAVSLEEVETSNTLNRLNSKWLVEFTGNNPSTACTDELTRKAFYPNNNLSTSDDFDVVFPFKIITNLLYTVTKQLEPCVGFIWDLGFGTGELEVKPSGSFDIDAVNNNELTLSLPIKAEATNFAFGTGTINAVAELTTVINPSCGAGFEIEVTDIQIADITGSITWSLWGWSQEMDAATFLADAADDIEADLMGYFTDPIVLLPESFGINNVGQFVSIGDIVSNNSAIAIGLNVMDTDPNCN